MSFKSLDMSGKKLEEAKSFLKTATNEMQKGNANIEEVKGKLLKAQEKLYSDSGETSQKLAKDVNNTVSKLMSALNSTDGTQRQKLNDAIADVNKVNKTIEKEKDTRASVDTKTSSIISSLAGRLSSAAGGLNFSGKNQSPSKNIGTVRMRAYGGDNKTVSDVGYGSGSDSSKSVPTVEIDPTIDNFKTLVTHDPYAENTNSYPITYRLNNQKQWNKVDGNGGKDSQTGIAYSANGFDLARNKQCQNKVYLDATCFKQGNDYAIAGIAELPIGDINRLYNLNTTIKAKNNEEKGPVDGQKALDALLVQGKDTNSTLVCTSVLEEEPESSATVTANYVVDAMPYVVENFEQIKAINPNYADIESIKHIDTKRYTWSLTSNNYGGDYSAIANRYSVTYNNGNNHLLTTIKVEKQGGYVGHGNYMPIAVAPAVNYVLNENKAHYTLN